MGWTNGNGNGGTNSNPGGNGNGNSQCKTNNGNGGGNNPRNLSLYSYAALHPVNLKDPNGLWVGFDDAIATGGGAAGGVLVQGAVDLWNWELSSWKDYTAAATSGAVTGETLLYTANPVLAGAAGGAAHSLVRNGLDGELPSLGEFALSTGAGAAGGYVGDKFLRPVVQRGASFLSSRSATLARARGWTDGAGSPIWPANFGFLNAPTRTTLSVGTRIDRYGRPNGGFLSPSGTSYSARSLAPGTSSELTTFEVVKPIDVMSGKAAPWFGEAGGGTQYQLLNGQKAMDLVEQGYLRVLE